MASGSTSFKHRPQASVDRIHTSLSNIAQAAIVKRRAELAERELALELAARSGVGALDDPFLPPALKASRGAG